jgi:competence protein ComEC
MGGKDAWGLHAAALMLAGIGGSALQLQQPSLWPAPTYAALLIAGLAGLGLAAGWARVRWIAALTGLACAMFALAGLRAGWRLADALPAELEGRDVLVTGVVAELPRQFADGVRFNFEVERATCDGPPGTHVAATVPQGPARAPSWPLGSKETWGGPAFPCDGHTVAVPALVSLGWYRGWHEDALNAAPFEALRAGQRWRLPVRLKPPHGTLNPHGFDFELWLFEQGVRATGDVRANAGMSPERLHDNAAHPLEQLRQRLRDAIAAEVADPRAAGVLAALAVGDQGAIERSDWELFRTTGIAHLVSISGLHVTMLAWLAGGLAGALWRRSERAVLALPAPLAARWAGVAMAMLYALLAGWGVPAQRTVWMLATAALLATLGRRWPWPLVLLAVAWVVVALDPWALLQPGFWLSFVAVGLLLVSTAQPGAAPPQGGRGWRAALAQTLRQGLRTQVVATLGLAPLTLVFFAQVSVVGLVANLVAIPLVTLLVTPLALLGVLWPSLWLAAAWLVQGLVQFLGLLAAWPWAVWTAGVAPLWSQLAGLLGAVLLVAPLPWRLRALALPLMLPLFVPAPSRPALGHMEVLAADVGQGSAVLVRTRNHWLLHDAGPQYSRDSEAGTRVLLPLLRAQATRGIDLLMLSHRDADHVGGAAALLAGLPVAALSSSLESAHPLRGTAVPHTRCQAGQQWQWDGVRFAVLHPRAEDYERADLKPNALSCVLRVEDAAGHSLLLTGDIEAEQERRLLSSDAAALASTVLVVPHHGSKTSSTAEFLDAVAPQVAVVQAGYRNRFGHPAPTVLARYAERGTTLLRSDTCGAWTWRPDEREATRCERSAAARYWRQRH